MTGHDKGPSLSCVIELPRDFRAGDILAFHRRDPSRIAERVDDGTLQKGLMWEDKAACLTIRFHAGDAHAALSVDGPLSGGASGAFERMVRRMLGLTQGIGEFEHAYRTHRLLGPLIARRPGLRVPLSATPFEALTWAITGQQISLGAALSLRRRLIETAGVTHSNGLRCYPDARRLAALTEPDLRQAGFSRAKAQTLMALSRRVHEHLLPLDEWSGSLRVDELRKQLLSMRGIGPWTIDYTLLRGFGWLDGSLHGDAAVRRSLQSLLGSPEKITPEQTRRWLADFSPWRALVAAHLWALRSRIPTE